jgi:beta-galactosidase
MPNMNQKGMLTFDRRAKDVFYMYRANWNPAPLVYIASRDWTRRTGTRADAPRGGGPVPVPQPVDVYSNLDRVELFANGVSLGERTPDDVRKAGWQVPFVDGDNVIEARGTKDGRVYTDRMTIHFDYYPPDLRDPSVPFRELAVNVGSNAQYVDDDSLVWEADQEYRPGGWGAVGGERRLMDRDVVVTGSARTGMLVTYREGLSGYRFDVPDGEYEVELLFAAPSAVPRAFAVAVNGRAVTERMDVGALGAGRAAPLVVEATAAGGEGVQVTFRAAEGQPVLNGIHVRRR